MVWLQAAVVPTGHGSFRDECSLVRDPCLPFNVFELLLDLLPA